MLGVIRFCDNEGVGIFNSRLFDYHEVDMYGEHPNLGKLVHETNRIVRVPSVIWGGGHRCMYKTEFLKQLFTKDQLVALVSECEANQLNIRYGRVRPNTPTYEDAHQVVVPLASIYRMKHGVGDISGLLMHIDKYGKSAARP